MIKRVSMVLVFLMTLVSVSYAVPTRLTVRVKAHDAKFVGSGVAGVKVTVRDFNTNEILSEGTIMGGTGNTKVLMFQPIKRGQNISDKRTASFTAVLDINKPKKLLVEVEGPLAAGVDMHKETKTLWLIPGKDIVGDGIVFEFYGLIVQAYSPVPHSIEKVGTTITIGAHVSPMCGCPIGKNKIWNYKNYSVVATIYHGGKKIDEFPLEFTGKIGNFEGSLTLSKPGAYQIVITASDNRNNQGADITTAVALPAKVFKKFK